MSAKNPVPTPQAYEGVAAGTPPNWINVKVAPTNSSYKPKVPTFAYNTVTGLLYYYNTSSVPSVWTLLESSGGSGVFTTLTATGLATLAALTQVGTANINATGAAATTIGAGTGTVAIGNATGNTAVTGSLTASTGLVATLGGIAATGTSSINTSGAATTSIGTGGTGAVNIGNTTGNVALAGIETKANQPCFLVNVGTTLTSKTGNGATYTLGTDALTKIFDNGTNITTGGVFTAPTTGRYHFNLQVTFSATTVATSFTINIITTARTYTHVFTRAAGSTNQSVTFSTYADMTATNTATFTCVAAGEAGDTDSILGGSTLASFISGAFFG